MEVRRRECQAVEVRRQLTHTGVPVIQIHKIAPVPYQSSKISFVSDSSVPDDITYPEKLENTGTFQFRFAFHNTRIR
jgi:hypothetical protein